jgi:hypothetical protein
MRGIGKGQCIDLFVIPEARDARVRPTLAPSRQADGLRLAQVAKLVRTDSALGRGDTPQKRDQQLAALSPAERARAGLEDASCWLILNAMKTEKVQFELWTLQCARNVWRKRAMAQLHASHARFGEHKSGSSVEADWAERGCLGVFREPVDHSVSNSIPTWLDTRQQITTAAAENASLIVDATDQGAIEYLLGLLASQEKAPGKPKRHDSSVDAAQASAFGQEQEQQQEQEEQQEKEQEQQQQKEQEHEVEEPDEYAKEKYSREDEHGHSWPLAALGKPPAQKAKELGFFPVTEFSVHRTFAEKRGPLLWPAAMYMSQDHTHPRWRFSSHHRLKNIIVLMEWLPDVPTGIVLAPPEKVPPPNGLQQQKLQRVFELYDAERQGVIGDEQLKHALVENMGLSPDDPTERAAIDQIFQQLGGAGRVRVAGNQFVDLMHSQPFTRGHSGRYWVALSLREAESLRGAMHRAVDEGVPLIRGAHAAVALRVGETLIDAVGGVGSAIDTGSTGGDGPYNFPAAPRQQLASMIAGYQFMDSQHRYTQMQCRLLLRMLRHNVRTTGQDDRRRWFLDVRRCRRRAQGRLDLMRKGGVEQVLTVRDEVHIIVQVAAKWRLGRELVTREASEQGSNRRTHAARPISRTPPGLIPVIVTARLARLLPRAQCAT